MKKLFIFTFLLLFTFLLASVTVSGESNDKIVIVLDPGHGGHDPGTTVGSRYESEYNYDIAILLRDKLTETGLFDVYLTRNRNEYKNYLERALVAEKLNADMLISLHFNSNTALDPTLNGVEVLASVLDEWSPDALSQAICDTISKDCGLNNRGVVKKADTGDSRGIYYWNDEIGWDIPGVKTSRKSDYYSMISWGTKLGFPAIIVEHAYLSNASDRAFCDSANGLEKLATAEAKAIINYFTNHTHTYAETRDRHANCCLDGVYSQKCTVCYHRQNVRHTSVDPYAHAWTTTSRAVSCTVDGYVKRECQISRNLSEKGLSHLTVHRSEEVIPSPGHSLVTVTDTEAAHAVDGVFRQNCTTCGYVYEKITPGDPHVYECIGSVELSCTVNGEETYECTVCSHTYTDVTVAEGHNYVSDGEVLNCASDGSKDYICSKCGEVRSEGVEVPPHTFETVSEIAPDCENDGKKTTKCTVCGKEEVETLKALGHKYSDKAEVLSDSSYFSEGVKVRKCEYDASHELQEKIPEKPSGIFIIIGVSAVTLAVLLFIAAKFVFAAKRRLVEVSEEAEKELSAESASDNTTADISEKVEK